MKNKIYDDSLLYLIISKALRYKIIIFFITFISLCTAYFYKKTYVVDQFQTEVIIEYPRPSKFLPFYQTNLNSVEIYKNILLFSTDEQVEMRHYLEKSSTDFNNVFYNNIISFENLEKFIQENKNINELKNFLKKNKIKTRLYLQNKLGVVTQHRKEMKNNFFFKYDSLLDGEKFLNEYILFSKDLAIKEFSNDFINEVTKKIETNKKLIAIQQSAYLSEPKYSTDFNNSASDNNNNYIIHDQKYHKNSKILEVEIKFYENLITELKNGNITIDFQPFANKSSHSKLISKPLHIYLFFGLIGGLILSFIIIVFQINFSLKVANTRS